MIQKPLFDIITFDCYGTLVDWDAGVSGAFLRAAALDGVELEREEVLAAYEEIEPRVLSGTYRSYRHVQVQTALQVARQLGWPLEEKSAEFLPESLPGWPPFEDTNRALEQLSGAGYRLGILSNIDTALLQATLEHVSANFEIVITAEQVRSYKPDHGHFLKARERIGQRRWLHAAQSLFHDVAPATALGIPVAWINRKGVRATGKVDPIRESRNLEELAAWLC